MAGRRRSDRALRSKLYSPGRPPAAQQAHRRRFWVLVAGGLLSEDAAIGAGVSAAVGVRWFRSAGGMLPTTLAPSSKPSSGRYLSFAEREELAIQHAQGAGVRQIALHMGRSGSTISRELRRNAATRGGELDYGASTAQWHAERAAGRPKPAKLALNTMLRTYVQDRLAAWLSRQAVLRCSGRQYRGKVADTDLVRIGGGLRRGVRSKLLIACGSTFRMIRRCASAMRPSSSRSTCKAAGLHATS